MKLYKYMLITASLTLTACATENDDDWTPGPAVSADSPAVFFAQDNETTYEFEDGDQQLVPLHLKRLNSDAAVTVPLTLQTVEPAEAGIKLPASVEFAAGQTDAYVNLDCTGIPQGVRYNVLVTIPAEYTTPYGAGTSYFHGTVSQVEWTFVSNITYTFERNGEYILGEPTGQLLMLPSSGKMKATNFLGSGLPLIFRLDATTPNATSKYLDMVPLLNAYNYVGDSYGMWSLYDQATGEYPTWSPDNVTTITGFDAYRAGYTSFVINDGYFSIMGYIYYPDDTDEWVTAYGSFTIPDDMRDIIPVTR